jgi:hypothetical protein
MQIPWIYGKCTSAGRGLKGCSEMTLLTPVTVVQRADELDATLAIR